MNEEEGKEEQSGRRRKEGRMRDKEVKGRKDREEGIK